MGSSEQPGQPASYDALLLLSFGGPEGPDDVIGFLQNVTAGRGVPAERLEQVAAHYRHFGGVSPLNAQNRALLAAIRTELALRGPDLPVYWGNRNWHPLLTDTVVRMAEDGVRHVAVFVTSAYASYSGCRQYRENLADAAAACADTGLDPPSFDKLRHYFNHPGFVQPMVDATLASLAELDASVRDLARLVFVTHSIPTVMNATSGPYGAAYLSQHEQVCALVAGGVAERTGREHEYDLVFCSRSGPADQPWLGPDVNEHLVGLAGEGLAAVILVPIGFTSDHMEVRWDLDTEALATAHRVGLPAVRAGTVGTDPRFVAMVRELLVERAANTPADERAALGAPDHDVCPAGCCPNPRGPRPALAGADASMGELG